MYNQVQLKVALIRKLCGSLVYLAYFSDMLSMGVCTSSYCQTFGRLVQELNVCTVPVFKPLADMGALSSMFVYQARWF